MSEENPSYRAPLIVIIAIAVVLGAIAAYVYFGRAPVPYQGKVLSMNIYPIHREMSQHGNTEGIGGQNETYDEILLFTDVSVKNTARIPLHLENVWSDIDLPDQDEHSDAVSQMDFKNVFVAYPETRQYEKPPLPPNLTLQPGQQAQGMIIFSYQINKKQWDSAKTMTVSLGFVDQNPMVMHLK